MPTWFSLVGFLLAVTPLVMTPGASFTLVSAKGVSSDRRGAFQIILGTGLGILTHASGRAAMAEIDAVRSAYDEVADTYADHIQGTETEQPIDLAMIRHFAALLPNQAHVVDAGCGAGRMLPLLASLGCQVEGIDLSPGMIRRSRRDHPGFSTQVASMDDMPFGDEHLDGVFSWYSTIHSPDDMLPPICAEVHRILRPGGVALFAFQAGFGAKDVGAAYESAGHRISLIRHNRTPDEVVAVLETAGFDEIARMNRTALAGERDAQAVVIVRKK